MADIFQSFSRKKEYLVCIDSDGCAMDTMEIKHIRCFGPLMIQEWGLETWEREIQERWNAINLYTMTRGINRFLGLYQALEEIDRNYKTIENLDGLKHWVETAKELSNLSLEEAMEQDPNPILKKALDWSVLVNQSIVGLPEEHIQPFAGVRSCLEQIHQVADVAVVSSANESAIMEEWEKHGLLDYTDVVLSQNAGSKSYCIKRLLEKGYPKEKVLMVGDAPGDRAAAEKNGVNFFPILVMKEMESWQRLMAEGMKALMEGDFGGEYQRGLVTEFEKNLD